MRAINVIFLDFDGVLNGEDNNFNGFDEARVKRLGRIAEETDARIVVTSSWRKGMSIKDLKSLLRWMGLRAPIIGKTPFLVGCGRGDEIARWLRDCNRLVKRFVILDDECFDMGDMLPYLVQTKSRQGLTDKDAKRAVELLGIDNHLEAK